MRRRSRIEKQTKEGMLSAIKNSTNRIQRTYEKLERPYLLENLCHHRRKLFDCCTLVALKQYVSKESTVAVSNCCSAICFLHNGSLVSCLRKFEDIPTHFLMPTEVMSLMAEFTIAFVHRLKRHSFGSFACIPPSKSLFKQKLFWLHIKAKMQQVSIPCGASQIRVIPLLCWGPGSLSPLITFVYD